MSLALQISLITGVTYLTIQVLLALGWEKWRRGSYLQEEELPPISIIVAARNEAKNLLRFLPTLLEQNYQTYEVLLVLDRCEDDSLAIAKKFTKDYLQFRYLSIDDLPPSWTGKKHALDRGIKEARFPYLIFTDADCWVAPEWLSRMGKAFAEGGEIILGIGRYQRRKGWLNRFIRYETFFAAFQYIGWAGWKLPYMGVGRNMGYRREVYEKNAGFLAFKYSLSGDDDLFVNAYGQFHELRVVLDKKGHTFSEAEDNFLDWFRQKNRHVSASQHYSLKSKALLGIFHLSHALSYVGIGLSLVEGENNWLTLSLWAGRIGISWALVFRQICQFGDKDLLYTYPALDLFFFLYNLFVVPIGLLKKPTWRK